jgi:hypothetical protein
MFKSYLNQWLFLMPTTILLIGSPVVNTGLNGDCETAGSCSTTISSTVNFC